jgi:hypothetical protein
MLKTRKGDTLGGDLLEGIAAISSYTGIPKRRVAYLVEQRRLPVFWLGRIVCARKHQLDEALKAPHTAA